MVNQEQVKSGVRWGVSFVGGVAVGRGWLKAETIEAFLTNPEAIGLVVSILMGIWGLIARTNKNMVVAAANVPEVQAVVTTQTKEGVALADAVPSQTVVSAGTVAAKEMVKP